MEQQMSNADLNVDFIWLVITIHIILVKALRLFGG